MSCGHAWHAFPPLVLDAERPAAPRRAATPPPQEEEAPASGGGLLASDWDTDPPSGGPVQPSGGGGGGLLASDYESDPPAYLRQQQAPADEEPSGPVMHGGQVAKSRLKLHDSHDAGSDRSAPPPKREEPAVAAPSGGADRLDKSRADQMAEIRAMLAEVQASETPAAAAANKPAAAADENEDEAPAEAPRAAVASVMEEYHHSAADEPEDDDDPLRKRLMSTTMKAATKETDVKRLRKKHEKKERQRKHQKAAGSGAFLTGFLLIVMIAAGMAAMYLLAPQIVERAPETQNAMAQYVTTIDALKVQVIDFFEGMRSWVIERADPDRAEQ